MSVSFVVAFYYTRYFSLETGTTGKIGMLFICCLFYSRTMPSLIGLCRKLETSTGEGLAWYLSPPLPRPPETLDFLASFVVLALETRVLATD